VGAKPNQEFFMFEASPRELIVVTEGIITPQLLLNMSRLAARANAQCKPLFPVGVALPRELRSYHQVIAADDQLKPLAALFRAAPGVVTTYIKPAATPAYYHEEIAQGPEPYGPSPDYTSRQMYTGAAPVGVEAEFIWTKPGGKGSGVRIIDIEGGWNFTHEDLQQNKGGVVGGTPTADRGWRDHGTAVIGVIGADQNHFGVTGICPEAHVSGVSVFGGTGTAGAIVKAATLLQPGDIILIELHRPGPRATGWGQQGFIAIEWWPDDYDAIRYATSKGVIVIEAAGNGAESLDHEAYDKPTAGFPKNWKNPFRRGARDSGAILVGAGAPPPGTHGQNHGPDRSRLDFSNYGAAVDAQGWGREVTTCGYGDLQGGHENLLYTDTFSGTSSASPIVVGSVGCLQGVLKARGAAPMSPAAVRELLRNTGSLQVDGPTRPASQRIGNRPNLKEAYFRLLSTPIE
jgi:hypothetical protein